MSRRGRSTATAAGLAFRLVRREPSALLVAVGGAAVMAVLFLGLGLVTATTNDRAAGRSFRVAVAHDQRGADELLAALDATPRLVVVRVDDPADEVIDGGSAIGLDLPADVDARVAAGAAVDVDVFVRERHDTSLSAFGELWAALDGVVAARLEDAGGSAPTLRVVEREVSENERANQVRLGQAVAAMVCFLAVRLVGTTAGVLGRAGDARANEVLLLLPLDRRSLTAGLGLGTAPLHLLHLLLAIGIVLGAAMLPVPTLGLDPSTVLAMLPLAALGAGLLALVAASTGIVAGALGAGGEDTVSVGDLLALPFVGVAVLLLLAPATTAAGLGAFAIPVLGQALVIRDGVVGSLTIAELAVAVVATVALGGLAAVAAARSLGRERKVVRVTI